MGLSERGESMSTVLFFVVVTLLAVYGICQMLLDVAAWFWLPKRYHAVTLIRVEDEQSIPPRVLRLLEGKSGHPVVILTENEAKESDEKSLSE